MAERCLKVMSYGKLGLSAVVTDMCRVKHDVHGIVSLLESESLTLKRGRCHSGRRDRHSCACQASQQAV